MEREIIYSFETHSHPFLARCFTKLGFVSVFLLLSVVSHGQADSLYNPFPESKTNLPYYAKMCGSGEPERLSGKDVIATLDDVLRSEGLIVVKNRFIVRGDAKYTASSFNEKYKIGYIWIEQNLGAGMAKTYPNVKRWWGQPEKGFLDIKKSVKNTVKFDYQHFIRDSISYFKSKKGMSTRLNPVFSKLKSEKQKRVFFRKQIIDYELQELLHRIWKFDADRNSIPKQWAFNPPKQIKPIEQLAIIGLYWKVAQFSYCDKTKLALEKEMQTIMNTKYRRKWLKRSKKLLDLLNRANLSHSKANMDYQVAFVKVLNSKWRRRDLGSLYLISNYLTLDYFELGQIDVDNEDGILFIAPISYRDNRCVTPPSSYVFPRPRITIDSLMVQEELAKMENASPEEKEQIYVRLYGKDQQKTPEEMAKDYKRQKNATKLFALEQLESDLRLFIRWAKSRQE